MNAEWLARMTSAGSIFLAWHVVTLIICVTGLLLERALRQGNPHARSSLLRLTLLLALAVPLVCSIWPALPHVPLTPAQNVQMKPEQVSGQQIPPSFTALNWDQVAVWRPVLSDLGQMQDRLATDRKLGLPLVPLLYGTLLGTSSLVSLYLLTALVLAVFRGAALRRQGKSPDPAEEARCRTIASSMGVPAPPVLEVEGLESPVLLGFFRPVILLPPGVGAREEIYGHELTHLQRHDLWWRLFGRLVTILMPLQPGFWLLKKAMERADEDVCDDMVLVQGANRSAYAELLLQVAETQKSPGLELSLPMAAFRSQLEHRLRRLLDTARPPAGRISLSSLALGLSPLVMVGALLGAIYLDAERPLLAADSTENTTNNTSSGQTLDPQALALLQKVKDTYKTASSFSCDGQYEEDFQTATPEKHTGTFKILFAHPDAIRVDWTDSTPRGEAITSSVFTQDNSIFYYLGLLGTCTPETDMESALKRSEVMSHEITCVIPSLLRDEPGSLTYFTSLPPPRNAVIDGMNCLVLSGTMRFKGDLEIAIDPKTYTIRQTKTTQVVSPKNNQNLASVKKSQQDLIKAHPELAAILNAPPGPDFTSVMITTYQNSVFGKTFAADDFVYPVPANVHKAESTSP